MMSLPRMLVSSLGLLKLYDNTSVVEAIAILQFLGSLAYIRGYLWEPKKVCVSRLSFRSHKIQEPIKVAHLSDLHLARFSVREKAVLDLLKKERPDLILFTGDYLNLTQRDDPKTHKLLIRFLKSIRRIAPSYACLGSPMVDLADATTRFLQEANIVLLRNRIQEIQVKGNSLQLMGLDCKHHQKSDAASYRSVKMRLKAHCFSVLLFHSPELAPLMQKGEAPKPDLYLCGHTHGGQIRLPFFGALVTSSSTGLKYQSGSYEIGKTLLYVSRGLGLEGNLAPRMRLFCPPEVIFWEIGS